MSNLVNVDLMCDRVIKFCFGNRAFSYRCMHHKKADHGGRKLGRALGHFIFSPIGLKRILFTNIFEKP